MITQRFSKVQTYLENHLTHRESNAKQYRGHVHQIWSACDPNLVIFPSNALMNPESTKDNFYMPFKKLLKENLKLPQEERGQYIEVEIIKSKLCSLKVYTKFLINRSIFINLTRRDLIQVQMKISELCSS